jgi:hypothetical protein
MIIILFCIAEKVSMNGRYWLLLSVKRKNPAANGWIVRGRIRGVLIMFLFCYVWMGIVGGCGGMWVIVGYYAIWIVSYS